MQYEIGHVSLLGNRETNQDRLGIEESHAGVVLMLGDGLGGKPGGALAAETLVKSIKHTLQLEIMPVVAPPQLLKKLIIKAHYAVRSAGQKQIPQIEPGTTAVLCLIQNKKVWWAHVGDSRCYLFRGGLPLYRTQDDSYVEQLYQKGKITSEKRDEHPMRNVITQCIGFKANEPKVNVSQGIELEDGDTLLLCSDGFWEPLDDALIGASLAKTDIQTAINKLALQAEKNNYPSSDNTSAVAIRINSLHDIHHETKISKANTPLGGAIQDIEDTFNYYKDEMDE